MESPQISPKLLIFVVCLLTYTQPLTKLQNEIQIFLFFRTGYRSVLILLYTSNFPHVPPDEQLGLACLDILPELMDHGCV